MNQDLPVYLACILFAASALIELIIFFTSIGWLKRRYLAMAAMLAKAFAAGVFVAQYPSVFSVLFLVITAYTVINDLRLVQNRMNEHYLKNTCLKSFIYLFITQLLILLAWFSTRGVKNWDINRLYLIYISVCIIIALVLLITSAKNLFIQSKNYKKLPNEQLPTVTLAIPARNEDADLDNCLNAALASDYPKLEIIVLDDSSQDKTPEIIRQYAHDGVRFVQSKKVDNKWLAKNMAYQTLLEQSSGEIIMFMGVDANLSISTISNLVNVFVKNKCQMLSVMPKRVKGGLAAAFVQPMRYWWELAVPKLVSRRPPVLSTCWLINKDTIAKMGGFKAISKTILPEVHFTKELDQKSKYMFIRDSKYIGLTTQKDFVSQWQTAVRTHYPLVHKNPQQVLLRTLLMIIFLVAPFIALIYAYGQPLLWALTILCCALLVTSQVFINCMTNKEAAWLSVINFPIVVLLDIAALHVSMYKYEFNEVIWRGRSVVEPVMHVYPGLPKL